MADMILGGGVTGLAMGCMCDLPVFEACERPGGICRSYYVPLSGSARLASRPADDEAFRFEVGGGHWVFGNEPVSRRLMDRLAASTEYRRKSAVWFADEARHVPYPIQENLRFLPAEFRDSVLRELGRRPEREVGTMGEWLLATFGPTLCAKFFLPFHALYTAGLHERIAPQDAHKSPIHIERIRAGAKTAVATAGYNATFLYPDAGLDALVDAMAANCDLRAGRQATSVDCRTRTTCFNDGTRFQFGRLFSTVPLNRMLELTGLDVPGGPAPFTSVLVLNIGGTRMGQCPDDHWLYHPRTGSAFHRTGIYSNVSEAFLPKSLRGTGKGVSFYIERAFAGGTRRLEGEALRLYSEAVARELRNWKFLKDVLVLDSTWVDVGYTWQMPDSTWREQALAKLERNGITMLGRYGRWHFQGIAASILEGIRAGRALSARD